MIGLKVWLIFCSILPYVYSGVSFVDCGSSNLVVEQIIIPGCQDAPCRIHRGIRYPVHIVPDHLDPRVDSIELHAYVKLWGALFSVNASSDNPCVTECPLQYHLDKPRLDFIIEVPETVLRNPAVLYIKATHKNGEEIRSYICVSINVNLL